MMKKLISILLTLAMALSLCACGGPKYDESLMGVYTCYAVEILGIDLHPGAKAGRQGQDEYRGHQRFREVHPGR